ncbi:unnamed protein product [Amoebophrya sp. A120]|nr:unnamed protein product [Amoebophrya sp. A120]|eukprot:GSA120T00025846001.1
MRVLYRIRIWTCGKYWVLTNVVNMGCNYFFTGWSCWCSRCRLTAFTP